MFLCGCDISYQVRSTVRAGRWVGWRTVIIILLRFVFLCSFSLISDYKERTLLAGLNTDLVRGTKTEREEGKKNHKNVSKILLNFKKKKLLLIFSGIKSSLDDLSLEK